MAYVYIDSAVLCNEEGELLPYNQEIRAYEVGFTPKTAGGRSPFLNVRVALFLNPHTPAIQAKFVLSELNLADFRFTMGTGDKISYFRQTEHMVYVYLKFQSQCLKPIQNCLFSGLQLVVRDSVSNAPNSSVAKLYVKGY